jgi:excisionase family DNA binding protein
MASSKHHVSSLLARATHGPSDWADAIVAALPELCTTKQTAQILNVSLRQLYRYIAAGRLPLVRPGGTKTIRIPKAAVAEFVRSWLTPAAGSSMLHTRKRL